LPDCGDSGHQARNDWLTLEKPVPYCGGDSKEREVEELYGKNGIYVSRAKSHPRGSRGRDPTGGRSAGGKEQSFLQSSLVGGAELNGSPGGDILRTSHVIRAVTFEQKGKHILGGMADRVMTKGEGHAIHPAGLLQDTDELVLENSEEPDPTEDETQRRAHPSEH